MAENVSLTDAERNHLRKSNLVFLGTIKSLGPAPAYWSNGVGLTYQPVVYSIDTTLGGRVSLREVAVHHVLVHGSRTADTRRPGLSPDLFQVGRQVIVGANLEDSWESESPYQYMFTNNEERVGIVIASPEKILEVSQLFKPKE